MIKDTIEIIRWGDVKHQILPLNPRMDSKSGLMSERLDNLEVIRASYPYGTTIEHNGQFSLMIEGKMIECKRNFMPKEVGHLLDYSWRGIPLSIVAKGSFELFIPLPSHLIPLHLYEPGEICALYSLYDQDSYSNLVRKAYSTTAGARSLITLPKISHGLYNQRLSRKFAINDHLCPKTMDQQWPLFNAIAHSPLLPSHWRAELIIFSGDFVSALQKAPDMENEFLRTMWDLTAFSRFQAMYDLLWSIFSEHFDLGSSPLIAETAKHVIKIAMHEAPGYAPATHDVSGPIVELTDIFLNVYKLRYYLPIFMKPSTFDGVHPIYYSLHRHTFFHSIPERSAPNRTIDELNRIQDIILHFKEFVSENKFPFSITDTLLYKTLRSVEIDFFHPQGGSNLRTDITSIPKEDPRFMKILERFNIDKTLEFPDRSVFFNGCIRIRPSQNIERMESEPAKPRASMKDFLATMNR